MLGRAIHAGQDARLQDLGFDVPLVAGLRILALAKKGPIENLTAEPTGFPVPRRMPGDALDHIERFYNAPRQHSTLGYVGPIQFVAAAR